jgi:ABC-type glycerol-3-phosphate transport system substrate-binding protein
MKKTLFGLVLVLVLNTLAFAGGGQQTDGQKTLTIGWLGGVNQARVLREYLEEVWPQMHPDIILKFAEYSSNEAGSILTMAGRSKAGDYDVALNNNMVGPLASIDAILPIDDYLKRDNIDITKYINNGLDFKGKYYALPFRCDISTWHYNQALFIAAGLDPEKPPASMAEFGAYAKIIKDKLGSQGIYPINYNFTNDECFVKTLYEMGGDIIDPVTGRCVINNEAGIAALQLLIDWYKAGYIDPRAASWQYPDEVSAYTQGNAAMYAGNPARYMDARNPNSSKIVGNGRAASDRGEAVAVVGWSMLIFKTTKYPDAAWEFVKFCGLPETQKEIIRRGGDCNPGHLDVLTDPEFVSQYEILKADSDSFPRLKKLPPSSQMQYIKTIIGENIPQTILGQMTAKQCLDKIADLTNQALKDAGEI